MKKYIIPFNSIIKMIISLAFLVVAILDICMWNTIFLSIIMIALSIFFILFGAKIIVLKDNSIYVSPDLIFGWHKVQYKEEIFLKNILFVEVRQRDFTYSSRGIEKAGRGIDTRIVGNRFIEFNYCDASIKRIYCNDFSNKQINKVLEYCKQKNLTIK